MSVSTRYFIKGIELRPTTDETGLVNGNLLVNSSDGKFKAYLQGSLREVLSNSQVQTITNKTFNAPDNTLTNIADANISATAAISDTKLATISTTGKVSNSATTATSSNTASAIVARDSSGNFSAGTITASLNGNASTATTVTTNANLTGPITSVGNTTSVASQTGTGSTFVMAASPTITTPNISSIVNTGTLTLPTSTDTLVGRATTDTLTNKTISTTSNTITGIADTNIATSAAIARSKLASGTASVVLANNGSGVMSEVSGMTAGTNNVTLDTSKHIELQEATDATTTGANASLAAFTAGGVRLTNASLTSLANIPAGSNGQILSITNRTGASVNIIDSVGAVGTAANRIVTGTSANMSLANDASLLLKYDSTTSRWQAIGGSGGGSATSAVDTVFAINDSTDATKQIKFDAAGTTATSTTIQGSQTANRVVTLPDATTTLDGINNTATLTNKTIAAVSNTIVTAASGNLTSTDLNAALNELQVDVDDSRLFNRLLQFDASAGVGVWSTGNNATFLGGGTISGTLSVDSTTPLQGAASFKYVTSGTGSANDYFVSPAKSVDIRFRGQQVYLTFPYSYAGNASDLKIVVYDATNSAILTATTDTIVPTIALGGSGTVVQTATVGCIIPTSCTSIRVGFQFMIAGATVRTFQFDSLSISTDVASVSNVANLTDWTSYTPTFTGFGTVTAINARYRRVGNNIELNMKFTPGTTTASTSDITLPTGLTISSAIASGSIFGMGQAARVGSDTLGVIANPSGTSVGLSVINSSNSFSGLVASSGAAFQSGVSLGFVATIPILGWDSYNTNIVLPVQQISSDTMSFVFQSTALTGNEAIGTFNTYTAAANTNTFTIATSAPTQTTSSMSTNGIQVFTRAYNATSTAASPARVDIFIGKGLKGRQVDCYAALAKATPIAYDRQVAAAASTESGVNVYYSETTGILTIDGATCRLGTSTAHTVDDVNLYTSAYFVINASKSPSIASIIIPATPTVQKFTSGSGTYTPTSSAVKWIRVRMVGGGGGAGAAGNGGAGGATTFGTSLLTCNGGAGGTSGINNNGGTATINSPAIGTAITGNAAAPAGTNATNGSNGAPSPLFGGGGSGGISGVGNGTAGTANTGGGGGGSGGTPAYSGGGSGGCIDAIIKSPTTYAYSIGAGGTSTTAAGGSGYIEVTEYYI